MQGKQLFFWGLSGSLVGLGLLSLDIFYVSGLCLLVGIGIGLYAIRLGTSGFWMAALTFGALPALIIALPFIFSPPLLACGNSVYLSGTNVGCYSPSVVAMGLIFGLIALVGIAWPLLRRRLLRPASGER